MDLLPLKHSPNNILGFHLPNYGGYVHTCKCGNRTKFRYACMNSKMNLIGIFDFNFYKHRNVQISTACFKSHVLILA